MDTNSVLIGIIYLPAKFNSVGNNESAFSILKETGYFEIFDQINENNINKILAKYPECINRWLEWSEDKRSSSGWYFNQNNNGTYAVGHSPTVLGVKVTEYDDIKEACSAFIKKEIEEIRKS